MVAHGMPSTQPPLGRAPMGWRHSASVIGLVGLLVAGPAMPAEAQGTAEQTDRDGGWTLVRRPGNNGGQVCMASNDAASGTSLSLVFSQPTQAGPVPGTHLFLSNSAWRIGESSRGQATVQIGTDSRALDFLRGGETWLYAALPAGQASVDFASAAFGGVPVTVTLPNGERLGIPAMSRGMADYVRTCIRTISAPPPPVMSDPFAAAARPQSVPAPQAEAPRPSASAEHPTVAQVRAVLAAVAPDAQLSYRAVEVLDPASGSIRLLGVSIVRPAVETCTSEEVTVQEPRSDGASGIVLRNFACADSEARITVERIEVAGAALQRGEATSQRLYSLVSADSVRVGGIVVRGRNFEGKLASLEVSEYGLGRAGRAAVTGLEMHASDGQRVEFGLRLASVRGAELPTLIMRVARGDLDVPADSFHFEGLSARTVDGEATLTSLDVEEYSDNRPGRVALAGLEVLSAQTAKRYAVGIRSASVRGLYLPTFLNALIRQELPDPSSLPDGRQSAELEGIAVAAVAPAGRQPLGDVDAVRLNLDHAADRPVRADFAIRGVRVGGDALSQAEPLRALRYASLSADLTAAGRWTPAAGTLELTSLALAIPEVGRLSLQATLGGVTPEVAEQGAIEQARLVSAGLRYVDSGVYARIVRAVAVEQRVPEAQVRKQHAMAAGMLLASPAGGGPLDALRDAVSRFINGQVREIELTLRPARPLPLGPLVNNPPNDPAAAAKLLGLSAQAR